MINLRAAVIGLGYISKVLSLAECELFREKCQVFFFG